MAKKRRHLVTLLLAVGIFTSKVYAEEQVRLITDPTALKTLTLILEKGDTGTIEGNGIEMFQGKLSNHDVVLRDYLIASDLYNEVNADFFIRTISQDEVADMIDLLNDPKLKETMGAVAVTHIRQD
jgi:hypothetical protein